MGKKEPLEVRNVGRSVSKPAWTVGEILLVTFTGGIAWPWVWNRHRKRTMITKHR
ncbi:hypothetical protein [Nonomuraea sp. NPDC049646]|uniref:hypothetical protein n=1 Tax=Nonomuraea sp. NPDC049646 TaxID=3364354 RepID=UPI00378BED0E